MDNVLLVLVASQAQKDGLTQLVVASPLGKFDLSDQDWFNPMAPLHDRRRDAKAPAARFPLRQIDEWTGRKPDLLQAVVQCGQGFFGESSPDSPGEEEPIGSVVADEQSAEIIAAAIRNLGKGSAV